MVRHCPKRVMAGERSDGKGCTYDGAEDVALVGVPVAQAQVDEYRCLVLGDGRVVDRPDLRKFVGVHEVE